MDSTTDLARIASDLTLLVERLLALTVVVAIVGGALVLGALFLYLRMSALESIVHEAGKVIVRRINGRIDEIEFPASSRR